MRILSFLHNQVSDKAGTPPGTLAYIGKPQTQSPGITIFRYNEADLVEIHDAGSNDWISDEPNKISWINIDGIHDLDLIRQIGAAYQLHSLVLEDIVNTTQRPRLEEYGNGLYLVLKMVSYDESSGEINTEQVSLFWSENYVLTFQEKAEDVFDPIRKRLKQNTGRLRKKGADYLFYALIDIVISNYFAVLEGIEDQIDQLEERLHESVSPTIIQEIQTLKRNLIFFRKSVMPLREVMNQFSRAEEFPTFDKQNLIYIRDLQGQLIQVLDLMETYREILSNLYDFYFALNGQRMNEIVKVLTIVSSIFIPLTFIAGIYGMNFQYMPELAWKYGYYIILGILGLITLVLLIIFRRKSWL